jgi:plasmid stabilization system protein ParE
LRAARELLEKFRETFNNLAAMPNMGHTDEKTTNMNVLFWFVKKYLVVYEIVGSDINIVRVLSTYRDIAEILKGDI